MPTYYFRSERKRHSDGDVPTICNARNHPVYHAQNPAGAQNFESDWIENGMSNNDNAVRGPHEPCVNGNEQQDNEPYDFRQPRLKTVATTRTRKRRHALGNKPGYGLRSPNLRSLFVLSLTALLITATRRASNTLYNTLYRDGIFKHTATPNDLAFPMGHSLNTSVVARDVENRSEMLLEPNECKIWRDVAHIPSRLMLYRSHFNSPQVIDWFIYAAIFDEKWHRVKSHQPQYLDVGAKYARRDSRTWFFDRCLDWHGVCIESYQKFWKDLEVERNCRLIHTSLSAQKVGNATAPGEPVVAPSENDTANPVECVEGQQATHNCSDSGRDVSCQESQSVVQEYGKLFNETFHDGRSGKFHIDLMLTDADCHELSVLRAIDWNRTEIDVLVTSGDDTVAEILEGNVYEHFSGILANELWIRVESELRINYTVANWLASLDMSNYTFSEVDDGEAFVYT